MEPEIVCTICNTRLHDGSDEVKTVLEKGLGTFIKISQGNGDEKWRLWEGKLALKFHESCRKKYGRHPDQPLAKRKKRELRSEELSSTSASDITNDFNFADLCFICGSLLDKKHKATSTVQTKDFRDTIIDLARRRDDDQGRIVLHRLEGIVCLASIQASYHRKCYKHFLITVPKESQISQRSVKVEALISKVCKYIETSGSFQFKISELQEVMGKDGLSKELLMKKLEEKYGEEIRIVRHQGRETKIYYKTFDFTKICSDWFCDEGSLGEVQKKTILDAAAKILRDEVKKFSYNNESYPAADQFLNNVVSDIPPVLTEFLQNLLDTVEDKNSNKSSVKRDQIAHSIVSILRPRSFISNLQLAVGTYIHRKTGSKLVIELLSKLGACASYHNIHLHEASIIMDPPQLRRDPETFVQFVFDNTDHNVSTLDGHETFHCLGGIAIYTPHDAISYVGTSQKCHTMPTASELASQKRIQTVPHRTFNSTGLEDIEFVATDTLQLGEPPLLPLEYAVYLWAKSLEIPNVPSWRGFMEVLSENETFIESTIHCLPFINEAPSKPTTIYTSLCHAAAEGREMGLKTVFVTYDQPLHRVARTIVAQSAGGQLNNIVVRLGGFHLLMSYLGAVGYIMNESGLEDLWSVAYAPESVKKMLTGHAFSRALRAHILTFTALGIVICKSINITQEFENLIHKEFEYWQSMTPLLDDFDDERFLREKTQEFTQKLQALENNGPTAKLWLQYFQLVLIALQYVHAERIGNWTLHLQCVKQMLPIFHAAGHFSYAKSAQIYLQDMANLGNVMDPQEYDQYTSGYFTVHRTDKAWSGVWSDMVIEQTLNRFFGTDLKHGRGVTPSVLARYLLAMPSAYNIMECLEKHCDIESSRSEQHIDLSHSRIGQDEKDIKKMVFWLNKHTPFAARDSLISLSTGIIGGSNINCHMAVEKGSQGMATMIGKNAKNISLSTVYKVKNLGSVQNKTHLDDDRFTAVDTYLLFQKISVLFQGNDELTRKALSYELSPVPLSLFDEKGLMRKTAKAELYKIFTPYTQRPQLISSHTFVIDGGWLLHQITWAHTSTYRDVFRMYLSYIITNFGANSTVVFDGYQNELIGTKSYERYRRKEKIVAADIEIAEDKILTLQKTKFLSNTANKFKFVDLLSQFLKRHKITTDVANGDADTLIIQTAISLREKINAPVAVVGNDVDLMVLLIALTPEGERMYFLKNSGRNNNVLYSSHEQNHLKPFILFAHAFAGCDTTNAIYKKGKKTIVSVLHKNPNLQKLISVFYEERKTADELYLAAEKFIIHLYKTDDKQELTINELRYKIFTTSVPLAKKELSLALLPPTKSALYEHAKRVYYQMQIWLGNTLNPLEWGWRRKDSLLLPIMFQGEPAPRELLDSIFCGCQTNCIRNCRCKIAGMPCGQLCKNCHGQSCNNAYSEAPTEAPLENEVEMDNDGGEDDEQQETENFIAFIPEDDDSSIEVDFRYY